MFVKKLYGASPLALFCLFYGVYWLVSLLVSDSANSIAVVNILATLVTTIELLWLYQLNVDLGRLCGYRPVRAESLFCALLVVMLVVPLVVAPELSAQTSIAPSVFVWSMLVLMVGAWYLTSAHVAQKLVTCELARSRVESSQARTTLAFLFLPVGIWFIQPRIKRLLAVKDSLQS